MLGWTVLLDCSFVRQGLSDICKAHRLQFDCSVLDKCKTVEESEIPKRPASCAALFMLGSGAALQVLGVGSSQ